MSWWNHMVKCIPVSAFHWAKAPNAKRKHVMWCWSVFKWQGWNVRWDWRARELGSDWLKRTLCCLTICPSFLRVFQVYINCPHLSLAFKCPIWDNKVYSPLFIGHRTKLSWEQLIEIFFYQRITLIKFDIQNYHSGVISDSVL